LTIFFCCFAQIVTVMVRLPTTLFLELIHITACLPIT